jgi:hypothetical protein
MTLFPGIQPESVQPQAIHDQHKIDYDSLIKMMTPMTPSLDSFDDVVIPLAQVAPVVPVAAPVSPSQPTKPLPSRRRGGATGIRKGITPDSLLDEEAPTQSRKYVTPSATSKKAVPAVFARKRARSAAFPEEEDQLEDGSPDPSELDLIEQKRRQNTVAARRSRKRKLEYYQALERGVVAERQLKEQWKERTAMLLSIIRGTGMNLPDFPPDPPSDPLLDNIS